MKAKKSRMNAPEPSSSTTTKQPYHRIGGDFESVTASNKANNIPKGPHTLPSHRVARRLAQSFIRQFGCLYTETMNQLTPPIPMIQSSKTSKLAPPHTQPPPPPPPSPILTFGFLSAKYVLTSCVCWVLHGTNYHSFVHSSELLKGFTVRTIPAD